MIDLVLMDKWRIREAQEIVKEHHYLHTPVDARCSVEGYWVRIEYPPVSIGPVGLFLAGRPEATKVRGWYGSVEDQQAGRCEVTRWQVLNLARVWLHPDFQNGGKHIRLAPGYFMDRKGVGRSTLASCAISALAARVGFDYLMRRPPCFLDEPYQIEWLLSYCDTRLHRGTIYQAAGFELFRTNKEGIQTWRVRLPALTPEQNDLVREASRVNKRSQVYRAKRAQLNFMEEMR